MIGPHEHAPTDVSVRLDPAQFYTGIVAECYAPLRGSAPDPNIYARFIATSGEPALELGCGDGDPLIDLRLRGILVEGLDSSADMLHRAQRRADAHGLQVRLHCSTIEAMQLGQTYRSIFLAGPTFNLIIDDTLAQRSLDNIAAHLTTGGRALVPLFIPQPLPPQVFGVWREHTSDDGILMRFQIVDEKLDAKTQTQVTTTRYELTRDGVTSTVDRPWMIHWHTQAGFSAMVAKAGLLVHSIVNNNGGPAVPDDTGFTFRVTKP